MSARCYEGLCGSQDIDETASRVRFFLMAAALVVAVYGGMALGNMVVENLGR